MRNSLHNSIPETSRASREVLLWWRQSTLLHVIWDFERICEHSVRRTKFGLFNLTEDSNKHAGMHGARYYDFTNNQKVGIEEIPRRSRTTCVCSISKMPSLLVRNASHAMRSAPAVVAAWQSKKADR